MTSQYIKFAVCPHIFLSLSWEMSAPSQLGQASALTEAEKRQKALEDYRKRLIEHRELDAKLKKSKREATRAPASFA